MRPRVRNRRYRRKHRVLRRRWADTLLRVRDCKSACPHLRLCHVVMALLCIYLLSLSTLAHVRVEVHLFGNGDEACTLTLMLMIDNT